MEEWIEIKEWKDLHRIKTIKERERVFISICKTTGKVISFTCDLLWDALVFSFEAFGKIVDSLKERHNDAWDYPSEDRPSWSANSFNFSRGIKDAVQYDAVQYDGADKARNLIGGFLRREVPVRQTYVQGHYRMYPSASWVQGHYRTIEVRPTYPPHPVYGYKYPGKERYSI